MKQDRIVGGFEAQENQWPWEVALFIDDAWFCGGSLISGKRWKRDFLNHFRRKELAPSLQQYHQAVEKLETDFRDSS